MINRLTPWQEYHPERCGQQSCLVHGDQEAKSGNSSTEERVSDDVDLSHCP